MHQTHSINPSNDARRCRHGISLVEVVMSSILVGLIVVGSLDMLGASVRTQVVSNNLATGPELAEALLAEIMSLPYSDPEDGEGALGRESGESGGSRATWDDVDDYNGWTQSPPHKKNNAVMTDYIGWTRAASVNWADQLTGTYWVTNTGLKRIIVTVTAPDGVVTKRCGWRSDRGSLEQAGIVDQTVVSRIDTSLKVGTAPTAFGTTNLLNHVEAP